MLIYTALSEHKHKQLQVTHNETRPILYLEGIEKESQQPTQCSFVSFYIVSMLRLSLEASVQNSAARG